MKSKDDYEAEGFLNIEVFQIQYITQFGKNNWDLETYRKSSKMIKFQGSMRITV